MKEFEKIIGYGSIKKELEQIANVFGKNGKCDKISAKMPKGILIHGVPGVGKTMMAEALIRAMGFKSFVCRKNETGDNFIKSLNEAYANAESEAPAIVFLDDLDKFANDDIHHPNSKEYAAVQACMEKTKNKSIMTIATANELNCIPKSLRRRGRFDKTIYVDVPDRKDLESIIKYYVTDKRISKNADYQSVVKAVCGLSGADIAAIVNEAGMYAGNENSEYITPEHLIKAIIRIIFKVSIFKFEEMGKTSCPDLRYIAYHEAGHTVVQEILDPGSVSLVYLYGSCDDGFGGTTKYTIGENISVFDKHRKEIIARLAGKAAIEVKFGVCDLGASDDLNTTFSQIEGLIAECGTLGFSLFGTCPSCDLDAKREVAVAAEMEKYYMKAKKLIISNMDFLDGIANKLLEKKYLCSSDIDKIRA